MMDKSTDSLLQELWPKYDHFHKVGPIPCGGRPVVQNIVIKL